MKVLFLHGLESNPGGSKVQHLLDLGHTVLNPALPKHDFEESVRIAQEEVDTNHPDVIVGSSRGGAVAMAVDRAGARLVLIAPAWQRFGGAASVPPGTSVLHCTTDDQVPFSDSEQLQGANLIPCGEGHRMIDPNALESLGQAVEGTLKTETLVREYIRELLIERDNSAGPGLKYIYRGMKIDMPTANLASQIRKVARGKPSGLSEREAGSFIMAQLKNEEIGESWSTNMDVAASFADVWSATNRGKTLHVMFWGKVPNDFGYDPTTTGDEPWMFEDESEVRIPKGEEIEISSVNVFIADKKGGKNWMKFKPVAYTLGKVKA